MPSYSASNMLPESPVCRTLPSLKMPKHSVDPPESRKTHSCTHTHTHQGSEISSHACKCIQKYTPCASLTWCLFPLLFLEPSVHLFQRTNTPDSTEEPLSPFHCSLNSTIELTRWRDKLEQKFNAHRGELGIENRCSCPKPFL